MDLELHCIELQKQGHLSVLSRHLHISKVSRRPQRSQLSGLTQLKALALSSLDEQEIIQATCEPSKMEVGREESAQSTDQISRHLGAIQLLQPISFELQSNQPVLIMLGMLEISFPFCDVRLPQCEQVRFSAAAAAAAAAAATAAL